MEKVISSYPLKYAVLELSRRKSYAHAGDTEVFAYVPARCALVKETKHYFPTGNTKTLYHVVFTWDSESYENRHSTEKFVKRPNLNATNANVVDNIYDDEKDCIEAANEASKKFRGNLLAYLGNKKQREFFCQKFTRDLDEATQYAITRLNDNPNFETEAE